MSRLWSRQMINETPYLRLQADYVGRLGVEVGIFVAVDHLRRKNLLTPEEEELYFDIDDWFREHLPEPPFYADGNTIGAITWFKHATTGAMLTRLRPLRDLLSVHDVRCDLVRASDPGKLVYEDEYQVGVIPRIRKRPSQLPPGVTLGPTTSGSKRHLARRPPGRSR
ncbi:hypothetical protein [Nonomuraea sp. C10]|uniref:hypothetical protein n=1 Tax=Nonomuraea sp. C10 TaxID=2600577 RepID=UPI0011CD5F07|nr:hypothetical protein [Nonomuraea sp. C10]TXK35521.1 hypothetical protein FR742_40630 [Nonomuraea sp. C10]